MLTDKPIPITREQWNKVPDDYKGTDADGVKSMFASCVPDGLTTRKGSTLVPVVIVSPPRVRRRSPEGDVCGVCSLTYAEHDGTEQHRFTTRPRGR